MAMSSTTPDQAMRPQVATIGSFNALFISFTSMVFTTVLFQIVQHVLV
jgi:hypothetical protein